MVIYNSELLELTVPLDKNFQKNEDEMQNLNILYSFENLRRFPVFKNKLKRVKT